MLILRFKQFGGSGGSLKLEKKTSQNLNFNIYSRFFFQFPTTLTSLTKGKQVLKKKKEAV